MKLIVDFIRYNFISYNSVCLHFSPKPLLKKKLLFLFNYMDQVTNLLVLLTSALFTGNQQILLYQEIQI